MRVAVFTNKYPCRLSMFFERDMRGLIDAGIEPHVFSFYPLDADAWRHSLGLLDDGLLPRERVHHLEMGHALRRAPAGLAVRPLTGLTDAARALAAAVPFGAGSVAKTAYVLPKAWAWAARWERYDHVLAYWGNYAATCAYAVHRLMARPIPFTIWLHAGVDLYRKPAFLRQKLRYADNVLTCCEFNRGYITRTFGDVPGIERKTVVTHHGLDLDAFPYRPAGRPSRRVVAVGRLGPQKGFDDLLRAVGVLRTQGFSVEVEVVGGGDGRPGLEALARELGVADRVRFRGWLPFDEAKRAMAGATILVHSSPRLGDGLPNVVREAMALGTPVVGTLVAGIPDALGDGRGVLVPPRDVQGLATAIEALLRDEGARAAIADRARRYVEKHYDARANGARLASLLRGSRRAAAAERALAKAAV